ncbi:serine O-acetyltransferase [Dysgonomonas sp. ZJ709]|uniref:serine O-acetyltransferase n=1 Tax=Dysgonomonas sp. ZJ709 TaxID=2709797 RepID=UPI0013EC52D8|nr:serine acetyltransferase [Dysgonomonas sp. ZJ709]
MINTKSCFILFCFRLSAFFSHNILLRIIGFPIRIFYKLIVQWVLGVDLPDGTKVGKNFVIYHGQGFVVNSKTIIGDNVIARHNTTIGNSKPGGGCPIIGNNVEIGANVVIVGPIKIGNNSIVGAGSVVVHDVPPYSVVVGNPAVVVKINKI